MEDREPDPRRAGLGARCLVVPVGGEMDIDRAPMLLAALTDAINQPDGLREVVVDRRRLGPPPAGVA
ncbi:hypothetical protein [Streptomyces erythrochromogenes]|uniref:hypothetical protein n=1 Tax=Streptomyces erythrochromogenes TaxID=285574 RepID=UPI003699B132